MLQRMVLKRVLGAVQRLENAKKKRSKSGHCGIKEVVLRMLDEKTYILHFSSFTWDDYLRVV